MADPIGAAGVGAAGVTVVRGVPFAAPPGFRPVELDLYHPPSPASAGPVPIVVFVHGGGWRVGSRASFGPVLDRLSPGPFERLALAGFLVASLDYRLSAEAVFPAQLDDVLAGIDFVRRRAAEFGADPGRMVLWGESSGGHLAALAGLHLTSAAVAGVVDWYGPSDLAAMPDDLHPAAVADPAAADSRESLLLGRPLLEAGDLAAAASPALQMHPSAPPFHLAHGTQDRFVPVGQSIRLRDALRRNGVPVELHLVEGADHLWSGAPDPEALLQAALTFARSVTTHGR